MHQSDRASLHIGVRQSLQTGLQVGGKRIAQRLRAHMTGSVHGMAVPLARHRDIGHPARWRFIARAFGAVGHGVTLTVGSECGQFGDQCRFA